LGVYDMTMLRRTVCVLDDGDRSIRYTAEILAGHDYSIFHEEDVDRFITMIVDVDPEMIIIPEATPLADENFIPMLRLFTDNIITVAGCRDSMSVASALLQGADLCVSLAMQEGELLARLHAFERRLLASHA